MSAGGRENERDPFLPSLRNTTLRFTAGSAAAVLLLGAPGCGSGDSSHKGASGGNNTDLASPPKNATTEHNSNTNKKAPPPTKVAGRSPGIKSSEPPYVDLYTAQVGSSTAAGLGAPAGTWTMQLLRGSYNLDLAGAFVGGTLHVSGDRMTFRQRTGSCAIPKPAKPAPAPAPSKRRQYKIPRSRKPPSPSELRRRLRQQEQRHKRLGRPRHHKAAKPLPLGPPGTYRWRVSATTLTLRALGDPCAPRRRLLPAVNWRIKL
jgi:hypothetical protein